MSGVLTIAVVNELSSSAVASLSGPAQGLGEEQSQWLCSDAHFLPL